MIKKINIELLVFLILLQSCVIGGADYIPNPISVNLDNWNRVENVIYLPYRIPRHLVGRKIDEGLYETILNFSWDDEDMFVAPNTADFVNNKFELFGLWRSSPIFLIPPIGSLLDYSAYFIFSHEDHFYLIHSKHNNDSFRVFEIKGNRRLKLLHPQQYEEDFFITYDHTSSGYDDFHIVIVP